MSTPFIFKQFTIAQDRCAMKIGTDGVLLGAWVALDKKLSSILDLGTGTGIVALQLAQRSQAQTIDAVEIDAAAFEQCTENFENSPWSDRLFCYHASVQEFAEEFENSYDLIVSNPPFYSEEYKTDNQARDQARDQARFSDALPFEHLIDCVNRLLSADGIFALILPKKEEERFISLASEVGLYPNRICSVKGSITSEEKRTLLEFSFRKLQPLEEQLIIENSRHDYTEAYKNLVKDFYLKM